MGFEEQKQESSSMPESAAADEESFFDGDSAAQDEIITLNIGGNLFTTRRQTCLKDSKSLLSRLLCDEGETQRDAEGFIFVDRDPKHFGVILNYLRDGFAVLPRDEQALREIMVEAAYYKLEGLRALVQPNGGWRPNFATQLRAAAMQQLRGDKLSMKASLDLILFCAYGDKAKAMPGANSRVDVAVYDYAEHVGEALAWTPPTADPGRASKEGQLLYTHLKQSVLFRGDSNSRWFDRTHQLRHRMIGEAPHLLDPEELESISIEDGKQRGLYHVSTSQGRFDESTADFVDSVFEVHKSVTQHALTEKERSLRNSALYIIDNLNLVTLALRLCDFKDVSVAVEAKHVPDADRDEKKAETDYPLLVLHDVRLAISLVL
ncbi:probable BTB/POZ domain-containing adapter for CUL3-mediated RhoA degradation protein at N-terminal half [Coccomyxa sp. Obi]|nr:probable BTB/POZ domain-containing adapter for CUL3-mediated RhoA degradation protein at N-terminal half [Coccomyxa sp. Obi]